MMTTRNSPRRVKQLGRPALLVLVTLLLTLVATAPANAYARVTVVHSERVQAGPYTVTVGFSAWPIRAMKSLDFLFMPDGGIADKKGRLLLDGPGVASDEHVSPLTRHPRKRDSWGLDVKSFDKPGSYSIGFQILGPKGTGQGMLRGIPVLSQPGPPLPLSWTIGTLPLMGLVAFVAIAWRRVRPGRRPLLI